ncbi:MAG: GAF domain-containing protein [Chloroflexi bacterium]|nr:GAF domain-containing protein [Chloroflexota bacterium]
MTEQTHSDKFADLRQQAEETLRGHSPSIPADLDKLSIQEVKRLFHELQVHQIELEMQNDNLRQTQRELEASRDSYADLYDFSPVGYFTISKQGLILKANLTGATQFEMDRGRLIGKPLSRFIAREDHDTYYLHLEQLFETRTPQICELRIVRQDDAPFDQSRGVRFWAHIETVVAHGNGGQVVCRATVSDITKRVRAEQALRQLNQNLVTLNQLGRELSATLDLQQVAERLLQSATEIIGTEGASVWLRDEEQPGWLVCQAIFQHKQSRSLLNLRLRPGQGVAGWVVQKGESAIIACASDDARFSPEIDAQTGFDTRSLLTVPLRVRDIVIGVLEMVNKQHGDFDTDDCDLVETLAASASIAAENAQLHQELQGYAEQLEQRVLERTAEIQAQYALLQAVLYSASDGIAVTDGQGEILQGNPVIYSWLAQTLSPQDATRLRETVQDLTQRAKDRPQMSLELTDLDLELRAAPLAKPKIERAPPQTNSEPAVVVVAHDVSGLKTLDRMKTRFVTNISHELRTPVTTIKLFAHLMQQHPEKWQQYIGSLAQEADHQARLVEDILQIARIDGGHLDMEPRPISLDELAKAAVARHQTLAQNQGLAVEYLPSGEMGGSVVLVNPELMIQVLNNLVGNGVRYTPEGGRVVVSTETKEVEGCTWATVTVTDTGMGILEEELPYIFDRFFRGKKPREMQLTGTGLGLSIAKEIVELYGGRVTVESPSTELGAGEAGVGSTFIVWLPVDD